ncbi:MAG TPA: hypothetical protein DGG95_14195 [Cytophagales bacterium]|jgi:hypothetical protein|nr:hypothetical protein [Cytophagales bacterium]
MKKHTLKLIEGNFTKDKASLLLLELLAHKIQYHQLQKFSSEERFGKDLDFSEKRIAELKEEKEKLIDWMNALPEAKSIEIRGDIQLEVN